MNNREQERLQAKTPEQRFLWVLGQDFDYAPKVAQAVLAEVQTCLLGSTSQLRPGQMRVILTRHTAGHGRALRDTPTTEVVWTVDAGLEDRQVLRHCARCGFNVCWMKLWPKWHYYRSLLENCGSAEVEFFPSLGDIDTDGVRELIAITAHKR